MVVTDISYLLLHDLRAFGDLNKDRGSIQVPLQGQWFVAMADHGDAFTSKKPELDESDESTPFTKAFMETEKLRDVPRHKKHVQ